MIESLWWGETPHLCLRRRRRGSQESVRVMVQFKTEHFLSQSSTNTRVRLQFDKPQGSDLHHRGDVFTPNTLLICQQGISTILGGDIKPAKTHLYADNMVLYTAAFIKTFTSSKLLLKHTSFHFYSLWQSCTVTRFQHHVSILMLKGCLSCIFFFLLNYVATDSSPRSLHVNWVAFAECKSWSISSKVNFGKQVLSLPNCCLISSALLWVSELYKTVLEVTYKVVFI